MTVRMSKSKNKITGEGIKGLRNWNVGITIMSTIKLLRMSMAKQEEMKSLGNGPGTIMKSQQ